MSKALGMEWLDRNFDSFTSLALSKHRRHMADLNRDACSMADIDLNSARQTRLPAITFKEPRAHDFPIVKFTCPHPHDTCMAIKGWLLNSVKEGALERRVIRMERLHLSDLPTETEGSLILLEYAAQADELRISILALVMPRDPNIRWFYSAKPIDDLLTTLAELEYITTPLVREPTPDHRIWGKVKKREPELRIPLPRRMMNGEEQEGEPDHHCRLFVFVRQCFLNSIAVPHHPDYIEALKFTDYSPEIMDPDTALTRIQADEISAHSKDGKDLSDDRYLLELHPAEREIASLVHLNCAEYLLMKRKFFFEFYIEMMHTNKHVEGGKQRVKSDRAHQRWLEDTEPWKLPSARARRCVAGWKVLGLLDERVLFAWIRSGGMLQHSHNWVEDDGEDDAV
ncbi:unnamed protein product [Zymoseptoria tritici ST99CH_3D7]|uniref:Uncharacterized protein n=3 Tax=Zymoseptoria tritici TaxID=1047171 RepID=A0A1X7RQ59_ZYMT9|nr:unnamed protein product [Zymoseptoria tritici ST99CH_3D7]SMR50529.1 unnamed protein product [Zymoseptoria tritici ST99CH_1E4]